MSDISEHYRRRAEGLTARVAAVPPDDPRWSHTSPCEGWTARDVVGHVVDAHGIFFGLIDHSVPPGPKAADDPLGAWTHVRDAMVAALEDDAVASTEYDGMFGRMRWDESIDRFLSPDVLIHTWDLARALGLDDRLDPDEVRVVWDVVHTYGDAARSPQVFGPEVPAPPDADDQERLLAFTGRDPRA